MYVIERDAPAPAALPGIEHATWAGRHLGVSQVSIWRQRLAPQAGTPPHSHDCDEVVLCEAGHGELHVNGQVHAFGPASTLLLPRGTPHRIVNTGNTPMEITGIFGASPVATFGGDGAALVLPWRS
jgi:quercetin dioxygenase-like cupin family protein